MVGAIRKRDILAHPVVTVRCFGWPVLLRTLLARRDQTFLTLLAGTSALRPPKVKVPELIGRCSQLEIQAQRIYEALAERFAGNESAREFFRELAEEEGEHFELLELCRQAACREGWQEVHFTPWRTAVPGLERQMEAARQRVSDIDRLADALRLVIRIETSEINQLFGAVVAATDSGFVRTLRPFQAAASEHISQITGRIAVLAPELASECRALEAEEDSASAG